MTRAQASHRIPETFDGEAATLGIPYLALPDMWEIGELVNIGWPDFGREPRPYDVVEVDRYGPVVRARVRDGRGRQGGFLVVYDCPDAVLGKLAADASTALGFPVVASELTCSINGTLLRSFDYEWWTTPKYAERPRLIVRTIASLVDKLKEKGEA